jgi:hypothetical protein
MWLVHIPSLTPKNPLAHPLTHSICLFHLHIQLQSGCDWRLLIEVLSDIKYGYVAAQLDCDPLGATSFKSK